MEHPSQASVRNNDESNGHEAIDPSTLRVLPSLDAFLRRPALQSVARPLLHRQARGYLEELRAAALAGDCSAQDLEALFAEGRAEQAVLHRCEAAAARRHQRVINATGIVLHTGIGRAPMADAARRAVADAGGYAVVEVDPASGERNQREECVAGLLRDILDVGGALVVNNNAAATVLALAALCQGREVVVSRGELVEIGGGFRMPDVMAQAGCRMVEVGTTNRTHLRDYQRAIREDTAMLLKVHTSNFRIAGFHSMPALAELAELAHAQQPRILCGEDLGSGLLVPPPHPGLAEEPQVRESLQSGCDLVWFSGDKLLGGPQAGIIVGVADLVARVRGFPLYRAVRCDKMALAALEATLRIYRDGDPLQEIPTLRALSRDETQLRQRAETLAGLLPQFAARVTASDSFVGSGANPARPLPSMAVALPGADAVSAALRAPGPLPAVFGRIVRDDVLLDLRSLDAEDLDEVAAVVRQRLSPA